jgi:hypothetical protein
MVQVRKTYIERFWRRGSMMTLYQPINAGIMATNVRTLLDAGVTGVVLRARSLAHPDTKFKSGNIIAYGVTCGIPQHFVERMSAESSSSAELSQTRQMFLVVNLHAV